METTGKIFSITIDGEEVGKITEYKITPPYPVSITGTVYFQEAHNYFMKALMYAITYKN